ncbi:MAG: multicopper oxidase domain-containing protein [Paracoccaceae bacterium]
MRGTSNLTRRSVIIGGALAGGGVFAATSLWPDGGSEPQPLHVPELVDARRKSQSVDLTASTGRTEFFPGTSSPTAGFNGPHLGPTLRVHRGDDVEMAVTNNLGEATTVHWHGLLIPGELDGGPHQTIRPGDTWRPVLPIRQPAATLWYHPHVHGRTANQVYAGLAGMLIVTDEEEQALDLPSEYGVDDLPIVLQDRQFEGGRLVLPSGMMDLMHGRRGDTLLVNGTPNPVARVPRRLVRLRLVNGANARIYNLAFEDRRTFHWIASEGGLLEAPVAVKSLRLGPGERAEVLVDFSEGGPVALETEPDTNAPMMMGRMMDLRARGAELVGAGGSRVLQFEPEGKATSRSVPTHLATHERGNPASAVRRRRFVMQMGMGGMMSGGMGMFAINDRAFRMDRVNEHIGLGDVEIWEVAGQMMEHPFHIHGVHFEVLGRNGSSPSARDQGLRDTIVVREPVELLVRFTQPAEAAPFMYHCHILEHEDNGMMGQFAVT